MLPFPIENLSLLDSLVLGVIQIMVSSFHLLMWYFLFQLYSKQPKGYFGIYNPITYRVHYPFWAISFFLSGILSVSEAKYSSVHLRKLAFFGNVMSAVIASLGIIFIIIELCLEYEMSYKNFSRANVGRMVSMILLVTSLLEFSLTFTYIYYILYNWDSLMEENTPEMDSNSDIQEVDSAKEVEEEKQEEEEENTPEMDSHYDIQEVDYAKEVEEEEEEEEENTPEMDSYYDIQELDYAKEVEEEEEENTPEMDSHYDIQEVDYAKEVEEKKEEKEGDDSDEYKEKTEEEEEVVVKKDSERKELNKKTAF